MKRYFFSKVKLKCAQISVISPWKLCTRSKEFRRNCSFLELQRQEAFASATTCGYVTPARLCERESKEGFSQRIQGKGPLPTCAIVYHKIMGKHKDRFQEVMPSDMRYTAGGTTSKFDMNTYVPPSPASSASSASRILTALDPISPLFAPRSPPSSKTPPAFTLKD